MRIFPLLLIALGAFGLLNHYGFIDASFVHLFWPVLLIGIGLAMLARGPRWRAEMRERMGDRWERRMHRHFGPGWAKLSEEERERFRAGMRQSNLHAGGAGHAPATASATDDAFPKPAAQPGAPSEPR